MFKCLKRLTLFAAFAGVLTSCAYHWGNYKRSIPGGYDRMAVPVFNNRTGESGVEEFFTASFIKEVERGNLATVTKKKQSQVVVEGAIKDIKYEHGAQVTSEDVGYGDLPTGVALTREYRVTARVELVLRRRSDRKVIWSANFKGERSYTAPQVVQARSNTANPLYNHSARQATLRLISQDLMAEAYDRLTENF